MPANIDEDFITRRPVAPLGLIPLESIKAIEIGRAHV